MLSEKDYIKIISIRDELRNSISTSIKINYEQVTEIVVSDLFEKYDSCLARKDVEYSNAFYKILRYYLTQDELDTLLSKPQGDTNATLT